MMETTKKEFIEKRHSELFDLLGCFFAFSNDQFNEGYEKAKIEKPVKYIQLKYGLYCPVPNVKKLLEGLDNIKKQWKKDRKKEEKIKLQFVGIDSWNRPVFKDPDKNEFFGDVNNLFDYSATETEVLKKVDIYNLCYFGSHFGCEPMGTSVPDKYYI